MYIFPLTYIVIFPILSFPWGLWNYDFPLNLCLLLWSACFKFCNFILKYVAIFFCQIINDKNGCIRIYFYSHLSSFIEEIGGNDLQPYMIFNLLRKYSLSTRPTNHLQRYQIATIIMMILYNIIL